MEVIAIFGILLTLAGALPRAQDVKPAPTGGPAAAVDADFIAMLSRVDASQLELQNGRPDAFKALWSRADDTTLAGGFGGGIERGWDAISRRLDWVATQFSDGRHTHERVAINASGVLGYVVQTEQVRFRAPGAAAESTRDYRVTMIFRRESGNWRIVHRQADVQTIKQPAR